MGIGLALDGIIVEGVANELPNCEAVYTGSIATYANVVSKMGVNAFGGALNLGYTSAEGNSNSYYNGITLGGGALAGAGFGGDQASTDSASDIAIGNGSGAGVEFAVAENVSLDLQYRYSDLGEQEYDWSGPGTNPTIDLTTQAVTLGVNFSF